MDLRRLELHAILQALPGSPNVYFQPPSDVQMKYPAVVYKRDYRTTMFASNKPYRQVKRYEVTIIDANPDSDIPDAVADLPMTTFVRHFTADWLNHDIYTLYY